MHNSKSLIDIMFFSSIFCVCVFFHPLVGQCCGTNYRRTKKYYIHWDEVLSTSPFVHTCLVKTKHLRRYDWFCSWFLFHHWTSNSTTACLLLVYPRLLLDKLVRKNIELNWIGWEQQWTNLHHRHTARIEKQLRPMYGTISSPTRWMGLEMLFDLTPTAHEAI
jgi:hypothetical protein